MVHMLVAHSMDECCVMGPTMTDSSNMWHAKNIILHQTRGTKAAWARTGSGVISSCTTGNCMICTSVSNDEVRVGGAQHDDTKAAMFSDHDCGWEGKRAGKIPCAEKRTL